MWDALPNDIIERIIGFAVVAESGALPTIALLQRRSRMLAAPRLQTIFGQMLKFVDFSAAFARDDRRMMWSMAATNGHYLGEVPSDMRLDVTLQRAAVRSNPHALKHAEKVQSDYEIVRACVQKWGWSFEYAAPELREMRELVTLAIATHGEALQHASEDLQADQDLALIAAREVERPLQPHHTSNVLLHNPNAVALLFPDAVRVDDDWLVMEKPASDSGIFINSTATHIPTKRWLVGGRDEIVPGLAPPAAFSASLETKLGTRIALLKIKVDTLFPDGQETVFEVSTNNCSSFSLCFFDSIGHSGCIMMENERMRIPMSTITLYGESDGESYEEEADVDLTLEPSRLTMTLTSFTGCSSDDAERLYEEQGGFRLGEPLALMMPASLGRRVQSEALFVHRWWEAKREADGEESDAE